MAEKLASARLPYMPFPPSEGLKLPPLKGNFVIQQEATEMGMAPRTREQALAEARSIDDDFPTENEGDFAENSGSRILATTAPPAHDLQPTATISAVLESDSANDAADRPSGLAALTEAENGTTRRRRRRGPHLSSVPDLESGNGAARKRQRRNGIDLPRKYWSEEETRMLLNGVSKYKKKWRLILQDPAYQFNNRSGVDLKDRYRTWEQMLKRSRDQTGGDMEKTMSMLSLVWNKDEDEALLEGFHKHGFRWARIRKDPELNLLHRTANQVRDHFRDRFPAEYEGPDPVSTNGDAKDDTQPRQDEDNSKSTLDDNKLGKTQMGLPQKPSQAKRNMTPLPALQEVLGHVSLPPIQQALNQQPASATEIPRSSPRARNRKRPDDTPTLSPIVPRTRTRKKPKNSPPKDARLPSFNEAIQQGTSIDANDTTLPPFRWENLATRLPGMEVEEEEEQGQDDDGRMTLPSFTETFANEIREQSGELPPLLNWEDMAAKPLFDFD